MSMFRRNCLNALGSVRRLSHLRFRNYASCGCVGDAPAKFWCPVVAPKDHFYVIERIDQYWETLMPGESEFLFPWTDTIAHVQCSNEKQLIVPDHAVFTNDLCPVTISGLVSLKIEDATRASYLPENPMAKAIRFAQTAMRSAVGKVAYDKLHLETRYINNFILNELSCRFYILGLRCLQFDIKLPQEVLEGMDIRAAVKRIKRIKGVDGVILDESQKEELHGLYQALSKNVEETSGTFALDGSTGYLFPGAVVPTGDLRKGSQDIEMAG